MKENQCYSGRNRKLMWLLVATAPKHFCGNRCAFLPLCLSPGARLHAEADAPSQWERGGCWRRGRIGRGSLPSTALPPAYCHAQQHLPTSHTVSAGKKQHYISENCCRVPSLVCWNYHMNQGSPLCETWLCKQYYYMTWARGYFVKLLSVNTVCLQMSAFCFYLRFHSVPTFLESWLYIAFSWNDIGLSV